MKSFLTAENDGDGRVGSSSSKTCSLPPSGFSYDQEVLLVEDCVLATWFKRSRNFPASGHLSVVSKNYRYTIKRCLRIFACTEHIYTVLDKLHVRASFDWIPVAKLLGCQNIEENKGSWMEGTALCRLLCQFPIVLGIHQHVQCASEPVCPS
jgi:hypothetical protein